jgi:hypothetical protein
MDLQELQKIQADYDTHYWEVDQSDMEKIRHITLHVGKLMGKLASYCEVAEHGKELPTDQIQNEVIPDLMVYAAQLANIFDLKLENQYTARLEGKKQRHQGK